MTVIRSTTTPFPPAHPPHALLRSCAFHAFLSPIRSINSTGMQYTGSIGLRPGWPRRVKPDTDKANTTSQSAVSSKAEGVQNIFRAGRLTGNTKERMEHVRHVSRPICDPSPVWILGRQDERLEFRAVDPMELVEDREARQVPERVAYLSDGKNGAKRAGRIRARVSEHEPTKPDG